MTAVVVAATGLRVVKHGNRSASSSTGSADVLEALGRLADPHPASRWPRSPRTAGITFCFANAFHPSMRHAAVTRRDLGVGTAFNALGPLTNPAQPTYAAVGVADARIAPLIAGVFAGRGRAASVFRGDDGLDELTLATTSTVWWVRDGAVTELVLDPDRRRASSTTRSRACAAATPPTTPRWRATCWPGRPGRCATRCCSTPASRSRRHPGWASRPCRGWRSRRPCATGWTGPRPPSTPAPPQAAAGPVGRDHRRLRRLSAGAGQPSRPRLNAASRSCEE